MFRIKLPDISLKSGRQWPTDPQQDLNNGGNKYPFQANIFSTTQQEWCAKKLQHSAQKSAHAAKSRTTTRPSFVLVTRRTRQGSATLRFSYSYKIIIQDIAFLKPHSFEWSQSSGTAGCRGGGGGGGGGSAKKNWLNFCHSAMLRHPARRWVGQSNACCVVLSFTV